MTITLYDTKARKKRPFVPLDAKNVRMYVCGPTVYDRAHLGNARPVVVFDVLYRLLRHTYGADHVKYVRNFTDVDDKINARAAESRRSIGEITAETTRWYLEDMAAIGALEPNHMPRATEYIAEMIAMIQILIKKGFAYSKPISFGDNSRAVYFNAEKAPEHAFFSVEKDSKYGSLSGRSLDEMIAGARAEVGEGKNNPMDFVLWKPSTTDDPGWESPWGYGRPGWHIECSAMAKALLGETFDIHGGGLDLQFPHHENEIAQSCAANGTNEMARYWLHNEMLQVEGKKMSKSLGNFFTVRDLLDQGVPGEVIRFVFLQTHYRKPMDWTEKKRAEAEKKLDHLALALKTACRFGNGPSGTIERLPQGIEHTLANDLDTWGALIMLEEQAARTIALANGNVVGSNAEAQAVEYLTGLDVLGLYDLLLKRQARMEGRQDLLDPIALDMTIRYELARQSKDFADVDRRKALLVAAGVEVQISKDGVELVATSKLDPAKLEGLK